MVEIPDGEYKKLRESEEKYRGLFENSPYAITLVNKEGIVIEANKGVLDITGYDQKEIIGTHVLKLPFLEEEVRQLLMKNFRRRAAGENLPPYEVNFVTKKGEKRTGFLYAAPLYDEKKQFVADIVMVADITERKQMEEELKESEEKLKTIFDGTKDGIVMLDTKGTIVRMNKAIMEIGGYTEEDIIGKPLALLKMISPGSLTKIIAVFARRMMGEEIPSYEVEIYKKNGEKLAVEIHGSALIKDGKIIGDVAILRDISERKKAEQEIKKHAEELEKMNKFMVGRETAMVELKGEINRLLAELGRPEKYRSE